jgi:hypothetical protein
LGAVEAFIWMAVTIAIVVLQVARIVGRVSGARDAGGRDPHGAVRDDLARVVRSQRGDRFHHTLLIHVGDARRAREDGKTMAPSLAEWT